jgi:hypothetical protein
MSEQLLPWAAWAGAILLAVCCLPIFGIAKVVVEVATWALRLALLGLLAGGAYLFFRPGDLPAGVSNALNNSPELVALLPDRTAAHFGLCAASWIAAALVPFLAVLEVTRRVASHRLVRAVPHAEREVYSAPVAEALPDEPAPVGVPVLRPIDRRTASATISSVWSRGPARAR